MKYISRLIVIMFIIAILPIPIDSAMDKKGKLEAHATAKKSKADNKLRCLAKSVSNESDIVNGWWGLTIQIDDQTWNRPSGNDSEQPQYSGTLYKRMYKRKRTVDDSGNSWAYISGIRTDGKEFYAAAYDDDITK